jgi:D-alanine--poly(phosphoribitol) ligase subunit 1
VLQGRAVELPEEPLVHAVVAEHARQHPDRLALTCGPHRSTYGELDARANQFAHTLRGLGITRGSLVGVCIDRTEHLVVAILGILKTGAAYVPLDPTYPVERLRLMLTQLPDLKLVAVVPQTRDLVPGTDHLDMTALASELDRQPTTAPQHPMSGADLCYVVFTSGSTGDPKAVAVDHRGWYNLLLWLRTEFELGPSPSGRCCCRCSTAPACIFCRGGISTYARRGACSRASGRRPRTAHRARCTCWWSGSSPNRGR